MVAPLRSQKINLAEIIARIVVVVSLLGVVLLVATSRWNTDVDPGTRRVEIRARMPEAGGWSPKDITARVGERLILRLTSDDVMHGFAIGGERLVANPISVDVEPGKFSEVMLSFDKPGKYTYYCTRWCGLNHWRMRGTIEVSGSEGEAVEDPPPLYIELGLDLDAPHPAAIIPEIRPSAARGALLSASLPDGYRDRQYSRAHSPAEIWQDLRAEPSLMELTSAEIWDLVAFVWWSNTSQESLQEGKQLYGANCAACHGETGAGDGVMAGQLVADNGDQSVGGHFDGHRTTRPTDFTKAEDMLGASPALLQGKILRGGMGTGMPYWGPILTDSQTWTLVDYLWTFQFENPAISK